MIRLSTILWALLVGASGYAMFQVKYEVAQLEDTLARVNRQIVDGREQIRVLNAEWSYLNQPARLDQLAKRYLTLGPIAPAQIGRLDALPRRADAPPAAVAAAPPPPVPSLPPAAARFATAKSLGTP